MKVRLKKEIADEILIQPAKWVRFNTKYDTEYGGGLVAYSEDFLGTFDVKETDTTGRYVIVSGNPNLNCYAVYADHIEFIRNITFKEDIFKILEA